MYVNNELQDFPTLKEFTIDKYIGGNLYEYYKEFFNRLEIVDNIIETLFTEYRYCIQAISFDWSTSEHDIYVEKIKMIASTVYYRMQREHNVLVDIQITDRYFEPFKIEYCLAITPEKLYNINHTKEQYNGRASGRTTRNANDYIQFAYQKWMLNDNSGVDIIDHFSYEMHIYDRNFIGRTITGPNIANHSLVTKIKTRINEEFPKDILDHVIFRSQYKLTYNLPKMNGIDYTKLE